MINLTSSSKLVNSQLSLNKTSSQQSTILQPTFGNYIGDFNNDLNDLNANARMGIQISMINLISPSKLVNAQMFLNKDAFLKTNYPVVNIG